MKTTASLALLLLLLLPLNLLADDPAPPEKDTSQGETESPLQESEDEDAKATETSNAPDSGAVDNLATALQGASGVKIQLLCTNCNAADLNVGGLGKDFADFRLDNFGLFEGIMGVYALSMVPADLLFKYEVVKGPGSVLTGPAGLGGGINITLKDPGIAPRLHAEGLIGSYKNGAANFSASGKWKKWSGDFLMTHGVSDPINPNGDGRNEQGDYTRWSYNGRSWVDITKRQTFLVGFNYYQENQYDGPGTYYDDGHGDQWTPEDLAIVRREWTASHEWRTEKAGTFRIWGQTSERRHHTWEGAYYDPDILVSRYRISEDIDDYGVQWQKLIRDRVFLTAGIGSFDMEMDVFNPYALPGQPRFLNDVLKDDAVWTQAELPLTGKLDLTVGLRYDDHDAFGNATLPRASLKFHPSDKISVAWAIGMGYRAPRPIFEEVCCGTQLQSNADVLSESSWGSTVDVNWFPRSNIKLLGGVFYYEFDDYIEKFYVGTNGLNGILRQINVPSARIQGADLNLEFKHGTRFGWGLGYTFTDPENTGDDTLMLADVYDVNLLKPYYHGPDLYHVYQGLGNAFVRYEDPRRGLELRLSGQYYDRMAIQVFNRSTNRVRPERFWSDAHQVWNIRASKRMRDFYSLYAGVDNIFDYWQADLGDPERPTKWGPQRGIFCYAGATFNF